MRVGQATATDTAATTTDTTTDTDQLRQQLRQLWQLQPQHIWLLQRQLQTATATATTRADKQPTNYSVRLGGSTDGQQTTKAN